MWSLRLNVQCPGKDYVFVTIERSVPRETHGCLSDAVSPVGWDLEGVGQPSHN